MEALEKARETEGQHEQPRDPAIDALEAVVEEIAEDAALLAGVYSRDTVVPEGGE